MEKFLGRHLTLEERVHHIDGNKTNNNVENLRLFASSSEHKKLHPDIGINTRFKKGESHPWQIAI
jgi:hypothetical protein